MIRSLRVARATAIRARTQAINALKALLVTAPAELREQLRDLPTATLVAAAAALDPARSPAHWRRPCSRWAPSPAATRPSTSRSRP